MRSAELATGVAGGSGGNAGRLEPGVGRGHCGEVALEGLLLRLVADEHVGLGLDVAPGRADADHRRTQHDVLTGARQRHAEGGIRSEEQTSELKSLMRS